MEGLELREANPEDALGEYELISHMPPENGFVNNVAECTWVEFRDRVLPGMMDAARGVDLKPGRVPMTTLFLWDGDTAVGLFRIRHYLNDALRQGAGHIGYGIRREYRGRGYATEGLRLTLERAWEIVPEDEIYMSTDENNTASLQVMLKNGATVHHRDGGEIYTRIKRP